MKTYVNSNAVGLTAAFFIFTLLGSILSYAYIFINSPQINNSIYLSFALALLFSFFLSLTMQFCASKFHITNTKGLFIIFLTSYLIITYLKYCMFFAVNYTIWDISDYELEMTFLEELGYYLDYSVQLVLMPQYFFKTLSGFNTAGTWTISEQTVSGFFLTVIWIGEFLIIGHGAFKQAIKNRGPYLVEAGEWAVPSYYDTVITPVNKYELEEMYAGNTSVILTKNKITNSNALAKSFIVFYKHSNELTGHIAFENHYNIIGYNLTFRRGKILEYSKEEALEFIDALNAAFHPMPQPAPIAAHGAEPYAPQYSNISSESLSQTQSAAGEEISTEEE